MRRLLATLPLLLAACNGGDPPDWTRLAVGHAPTPLGAAAPFGADVTLAPPGEGDPGRDVWLEASLARDDWVELSSELWVAPRPVGNVGWMQRADAPIELVGPTGAFGFLPFSTDLGGPESVEPGSFTVIVDEVFLRLAAGDAPPATATYRVRVSRGEPAPDGAWRVALGDVVADGLSVWSGFVEELRLPDGAGGGRLSFEAATVAVLARADADPGEVLGEVTFRVTAGDEVLFEEARPVGAAVDLASRTLDLPADLEGPLAFEVFGGAALCAFLEPVVTAADADAGGAHPDVVLFLADTFRADNLEVYGGTKAVTPHMDAWAADALVMRQARTPAIWTLPSQSSMLSGAWPSQHGTVHERYSLPEEVVTIAERFAAAGYRTGAVTDGVLVSRRHGFQQGFQHFHEEWHDDFADTTATIARFLDRDDGRPTFLFVQSYRAHRPYRVTPETLAAHGERLGVDADYRDVIERLEGVDVEWENGHGPIPDALRPDVASLEALYRAGVMDLDRGFGDVLDLLRARGVLPDGYLLLTADHGEAFGEHDLLWHIHGVWDEQARIPLVLSGPDVVSAVADYPASLVDVPATLAAVAGLAPDPRWGGAPITTLATDRPIFTLECGKDEEQHVALIEGGVKVIGPHDRSRLRAGEVLWAYDLAADPGERADLVGGADDPTAGLLERLLPDFSDAEAPLYTPAAATLGHLDEEALRAIGYAGEED